MRVCPMGGAPPHTDTDSASRLWAVSKPDCLKQRVRVLALFSCAPELSSCFRNSPSNARKVDLEAGPLDSRLETNHLKKSKTVPKP